MDSTIFAILPECPSNRTEQRREKAVSMSVEVHVPSLGESVSEATVGAWRKKAGDYVEDGEILCELETDKVNLEVPSPAAGVVQSLQVEEGGVVGPGSLLATLDAGAAPPVSAPLAESTDAIPQPHFAAPPHEQASTPAPSPAMPTSPPSPSRSPMSSTAPEVPRVASPAARKILAERGLNPANVAGTGKGGRITKADALAAGLDTASAVPAAPASQPAMAPATAPSMQQPSPVSTQPPASPPPSVTTQPLASVSPPASASSQVSGLPSDAAPAAFAGERREPMTGVRRTIARRLKEAQNTAAILTTFNDVDMSQVMALRGQVRDAFEARHGTRLGFMGFFVKACVRALQELPAVNARIDGNDIVHPDGCHIGVAVGTDKGLVVPVVRHAERMSLSEVEFAIAGLGKRAREGGLELADLQGGTFTITNGGVYGSMLSTPILNPPQSAILGMHRIEQRPVVIDGQIVARPMMYLALSYDHRIIDGKEAVTFLVRVKEALENPGLLLLDL